MVSQHSGEGKANQVLPARIQPGSRDRFRRERRRNSGQHADAWPRSGMVGRQLPDSRARERRAVQEGTLLRGRRRFFDCRRGQHQLYEYAGAAVAAPHSRRTTVSAALLAAASPRLGCRDIFWPPSKREAPTARGRTRRTTGVSMASCATAVGIRGKGLAVTFMGYDAQWTATDQVPERAMSDGLISRFGTLDASDGGETHRYTFLPRSSGPGRRARRRCSGMGWTMGWICSRTSPTG